MLAVPDQVGDPRHRAVLVHDLADDARGRETGQSGEVDRRLGLPRALQHTTRARAQREDMAGLDEVVGGRGRVDRDLDRVGPVVGGDAGRHTLARLDRDGERRAERSLVLVRHLAQAELLAALGREAEADQATAVRRHEVHGLGRDELRRDREIAFVLAVLVVDDDHEPARPDLLDRFLDGGEDGARCLGAHTAHRTPTVDVLYACRTTGAGAGARRTWRARRPRG